MIIRSLIQRCLPRLVNSEKAVAIAEKGVKNAATGVTKAERTEDLFNAIHQFNPASDAYWNSFGPHYMY